MENAGFFDKNYVCNLLSREISRMHGIWVIISLGIKEGYATLAAMSSRMGYKLFKVRPKVHMNAHIVKLVCRMYTFQSYDQGNP